MTARPAALLLAAAAGAALAPGRTGGLRRLTGTGRAQARGWPRLRWWSAGPPAAVGGWAAGRSVLLGATAGVLAAWLSHEVAARRTAARSAARRSASLDLLAGLAAELRAGADPRAALATAAAGCFPAVAAAARSPGADPAAALLAAAGPGGAEPLADLAAAWRVVAVSGAALAGPVRRLAGAARAEEAVRRELAGQLAGPRATATLLAGLPVVGLVLGAGLGADPLGFLLGTRAGRLCLLAGSVLVVAGTLWTQRIATTARSGRP